MDLLTLLNHTLQQLSPAVALLVVPSAAIVAALVEIVKRRKGLGGNVVQSVAAGCSLLVVTLEAAAAGALIHPTAQTWEALVLAAVIVWLGSIGTKEIVTDRGPSPGDATKGTTP